MKAAIVISCETTEELIIHLKEVIKQVRTIPEIRLEHQDDISISDTNSDGTYEIIIKPEA